MSRVSIRDWVHVNRHPRPATVLWGLHISLWVLVLFGTTGLALYEQVLDVRGEFSSGLLARISKGLRGSSHRDWFRAMDHPQGSWASLIGCGVIVAIFVIYRLHKFDVTILFLALLGSVVIVFFGILFDLADVAGTSWHDAVGGGASRRDSRADCHRDVGS